MVNLSKVFWSWDRGSILTELYYSDNTEKKIFVQKQPPTNPAHDISHFICGFHPDLEWDFTLEPNHLAEYNAVFMENLLNVFYKSSNLSEENINYQLITICEYMRWFSQEYYTIQQSLGDKYSVDYLKNNFLSKIDPIIVSKLYKDFYTSTYIVNDLKMEKNDIHIQLTIDNINATIDKDCYNFIKLVKKLGN